MPHPMRITPVPTSGLTLSPVIQGSLPLTDIGIYQTNSISITGSPAYVPATLYKTIIAQ
jgi:hypothetical protein